MQKCKVGIKGFDEITNGGFNRASVNIISGGAGAGKTSFGFAFVRNGAKMGEESAFFTLEETKRSIISNIGRIYDDIAQLERDGKLAIIDLTSLRGLSTTAEEKHEDTTVVDPEALIELISVQAKKLNLKRIVLDGLAPVRIRCDSDAGFRSAAFRIVSSLRELGATVMITTEQETPDRLSRFGVEEFMGDSITTLSFCDNSRTIEVHKMRGSGHLAGVHALEISDAGVEVYPTLEPIAVSKCAIERVHTGVKGLDEMLSGGLFKGDCALAIGMAGTGMTTLALHFVAEGLRIGEQSLYVTFAESPSELMRNCANFAPELERARAKGNLKIIDFSNLRFNPWKAAYILKQRLSSEYSGVKRIVLDPVNACIAEVRRSRGDAGAVKYVRALVTLLKSHGITTMVVSESGELGARLMAHSEFAHSVDEIIMLKDVEIGSELRRAISILKMRGSNHAKEIREYKIGRKGFVVDTKFEGLEGLLTGMPNLSFLSKKVKQ